MKLRSSVVVLEVGLGLQTTFFLGSGSRDSVAFFTESHLSFANKNKKNVQKINSTVVNIELT